MQSPLVSLGIPTYNRVRTLERTLQSALLQDYPNLEIIISDNSSTDATESLVQQYQVQDNRIRYIRQTVNQGPSRNFMAVLDAAQGEYFQWLADDDYFSDSHYISACVAHLEAVPECSLVCGKVQYIHPEDGRFLLQETFQDIDYADGRQRVLDYYAQVDSNGVFYGLMRCKQLQELARTANLVQSMNRMGGDFHFLAAVIFCGTVRVLSDILFIREHNWLDPARHRKLAQSVGMARFQGLRPQTSTIFEAGADAGWRLAVYGPVEVSRLAWAWQVCELMVKRTDINEPAYLLTVLRCIDGEPDVSLLRSARRRVAEQWLQSPLTELSLEHPLIQAHRFMLWSGLHLEPLLPEELDWLATWESKTSDETYFAQQLYRGLGEPRLTAPYAWTWRLVMDEFIREPAFFRTSEEFESWQSIRQGWLAFLRDNPDTYTPKLLLQLARLPSKAVTALSCELLESALGEQITGNFIQVERAIPRLGLLVADPSVLTQVQIDRTQFEIQCFTLSPLAPEGVAILPMGIKGCAEMLRAADLDILIGISEPDDGKSCPLALLLAHRLARLQLFCGSSTLAFKAIDYQLPEYFLSLPTPARMPEIELFDSWFVTGTPLHQLSPEVLFSWAEHLASSPLAALVLPLPPAHQPFPLAQWQGHYQKLFPESKLILVEDVVPYISQSMAYLDTPTHSNQRLVQYTLELGIPVLPAVPKAEDTDLSGHLIQLWEQYQNFPQLLEQLATATTIKILNPDWSQPELLGNLLEQLSNQSLTILIKNVSLTRQEILWQLLAEADLWAETIIPLAPLSMIQEQQLSMMLTDN